MPYPANEWLPPSVRLHLPPHAQDIYRQAFNHAWASHALEPRQEEIAHRTAWAAVKRQFEKGRDGRWHPIGPRRGWT
ncbi:MAG: ChaB family protein [Reyranellaceae bacterium]